MVGDSYTTWDFFIDNRILSERSELSESEKIALLTRMYKDFSDARINIHRYQTKWSTIEGLIGIGTLDLEDLLRGSTAIRMWAHIEKRNGRSVTRDDIPFEMMRRLHIRLLKEELDLVANTARCLVLGRGTEIYRHI